jgi:hypothetical protein
MVTQPQTAQRSSYQTGKARAFLDRAAEKSVVQCLQLRREVVTFVETRGVGRRLDDAQKI